MSVLEFVSGNLSGLEDKLMQHGAVLLRGFAVASISEFEDAARTASPQAFDYRGGGSPRNQVSGTVFTSTEFAKSQTIPLHIEGSYFPTPPKRVWFYCQTPARDRGNTPLGDMRAVVETMDADLRELFEGKELVYVSNLCSGEGFGKSWQQAYGCDDPQQVEHYLQSKGYQYEWRSDGGLRVETRAPTLRKHSVCGALYWCNQIVNWHWAANDEKTQKALQRVYGETFNHPKGVLFSDYSEIPPEAVRRIGDHLSACETVFDWQQHDVLILDNEWISHGRQPYSDANRRILVVLA